MRILVNLDIKLLYIISFAIVLVYLAPIIILRENSYQGIHDNLDSNHVNGVIMARNDHKFGIWHNQTNQIMGGIPIIPGPNLSMQYLLYYLLSPYNALMFNVILVHVIAFMSMLLLLRYLFPKKFSELRTIYFLSALSFALIRFWANAGISVAGLPLFLYGYLISDKQRIKSYGIALFYVLYSNFVLVGMFVLLSLGLYEFIASFKKKKINWDKWVYLFLTFVLYIIISYKLVLAVFTPVPLFVSHRSDYNLMAFYPTIKESVLLIPTLIFKSYGHNSAFPLLIMVVSTVLVIYCRIKRNPDKQIENLLLTVISLVLLTTIFNNNIWTYYQSQIPIIKMVQLQRFYWLLPVVQYILFFLALFRLAKIGRINLSIGLAIMQILILFSWNINYKQIVKKQIFHKEVIPTYDEFYSPGLLGKVIEHIGKPLDSYRVVSLGLEPAVALYNGFYSLEGYVDSYPLEHKRKMLAVMAGELNKNYELARNFEGWGNKVTIYSDDIDKKIGYPNAWDIPFITKKNSGVIECLDIKTDLLLEMNCQYLLSALEISAPIDKGLEFMAKFENTSSPYRIYLYGIKPQ